MKIGVGENGQLLSTIFNQINNIKKKNTCTLD